MYWINFNGGKNFITKGVFLQRMLLQKEDTSFALGNLSRAEVNQLDWKEWKLILRNFYRVFQFFKYFQCFTVTMGVNIQFLLVFVTLLIIFFSNHSLSKKTSKEDPMKLLVKQISNLEGVRKCNIFFIGVRSRLVDKLRAELVRNLQAQEVGNFMKHRIWKAIIRKDIRSDDAQYYKRSREQNQILNYGSQNTLFIFTTARKMEPNILKVIEAFYTRTTQVTSSLKTLVILVTKKPKRSYKETFNFLFRNRPSQLDLEILEISKRSQNRMNAGRRTKYSKRKRWMHESSRHTFLFHQYNPFTRVYQKQKLTKHVKWFKSKAMNLHGHALTARKSELNTKIFKYYLVYMEIMKSKMNFTCRWVAHTSTAFILGQQTTCLQYPKFWESHLYLKPWSMDVSRILTPVIHDKFIEENWMNFLSFFPLVLFINNLFTKTIE